eukprot:g12935.t1
MESGGFRRQYDCRKACIGDWKPGEDCVDGRRTDTFHITQKKNGDGEECAHKKGDTQKVDCGTPCKGDWDKTSEQLEQECKDLFGTDVTSAVKTYKYSQDASDGGKSCEIEKGHKESTDCQAVWDSAGLKESDTDLIAENKKHLHETLRNAAAASEQGGSEAANGSGGSTSEPGGGLKVDSKKRKQEQDDGDGEGVEKYWIYGLVGGGVLLLALGVVIILYSPGYDGYGKGYDGYGNKGYDGGKGNYKGGYYGGGGKKGYGPPGMPNDGYNYEGKGGFGGKGDFGGKGYGGKDNFGGGKGKQGPPFMFAPPSEGSLFSEGGANMKGGRT